MVLGKPDLDTLFGDINKLNKQSNFTNNERKCGFF